MLKAQRYLRPPGLAVSVAAIMRRASAPLSTTGSLRGWRRDGSRSVRSRRPSVMLKKKRSAVTARLMLVGELPVEAKCSW